MGMRKSVRGAAMVEYALVVVALVVGTAAAQKTLGPRVRAAANQTSSAFGGSAVSGGSDSATGGDERTTVTTLPKVGSGPDATKEEMAAADKNGDGVLSPEEQADLARAKQQKMLEAQAAANKEQERVALSAKIAKKRHEVVNRIRDNTP
jgi:Flp pilus assembly pilin Flp